VEVPCASCGAVLRVNPNLGMATVTCPQCGAEVAVPVPEKKRKPAARPARAAPPPPPAPSPAPVASRGKARHPYSIWLFGCQVVLAALGVSCLFGAFFGERWGLPVWSYLREATLPLAGAGVLLLMAGVFAPMRPVIVALGSAIAVLGACANAYRVDRAVDASRTIALAAAMLALWLAVQHAVAVKRRAG